MDAAGCVVRFTDRSRPAFTEMPRSWDGPPVREENSSALYKEVYLGRVIPTDLKKIAGYQSVSNDGVETRPLADATWRLPGSPGDEVWCNFWPDKSKFCRHDIDVTRILPVRNLPDQDQRTRRVDQALVHLYGDLCKGGRSACRSIPVARSLAPRG